MAAAAVELGFQFQAMACGCTLRLAGPDEARLHAAAQAAIAEVRRIEAKYSRYRDDSVLTRINRGAGSGAAIEVDAETAALLDFAAQLHAGSDGRFDATSGVLRRAWDFRRRRLPGAAQIEALRPLIGWPLVQWDGRTIALPQAGMELDFGGFGKEYAADRAATLLAEAGIAHGFVELGGDIRVLGPAPDGRPWRFGIRHPRQADALIGEVALLRGALATSGDYERFIEHGGRRYSHLLDARSGWPVEGWQSVSVVAPTCAAAGAVATLAMLCGEGAPGLLDAQGVTWLACDAAGRLHHSLLQTDDAQYGAAVSLSVPGCS